MFNQRRQFYQDDRIDNFGGRQSDFNRQNHERMNFERGGRSRGGGGGSSRNFDHRTGRYNEPLDNFNRGPNFGRNSDFDRRQLSPFDQPSHDINRRPPEIHQRDAFGNLPVGKYPIGVPPTGFRNEKRPLPPPPVPPQINQSNPSNRAPPAKNSFSQFRNLEEFKDFRRHLKIRKSLEGEAPSQNHRKNGDSDEFIFISPNDIQELKNDICASVSIINNKYQ